jgi:hypothetical protein
MDNTEWPAIGSWWRENDHAGGTVAKEVVAHDKTFDRVQLRSSARTTWAALRRFNGRKGGYSKVRDA